MPLAAVAVPRTVGESEQDLLVRVSWCSRSRRSARAERKAL